MPAFADILRHAHAPAMSDRPWLARLERELFDPARRAGLTTDPGVYADSYARYFAFLDELDATLATRRYLGGGDRTSAADDVLAMLLWLHETVFYALYKLNRQHCDEFANLGHYLRDVLSADHARRKPALAALREALCLESETVNPKRRIPVHDVDVGRVHDRALRFGPGVQADGGEVAGEWRRGTSGHRHRIASDGSTAYPAARGRYHLYIANNCPWCHRTAITRGLKRLEDVVSMDVLYYRRDPERGWQFDPDVAGCTPDRLFGSRYLGEIYARAGSDERSAPVLWDRDTGTIVSNESADIIRMFDQGFGALASDAIVLYPEALRSQIDRVNDFVYDAVNNGAYKAGFAASQAAYEDAYRRFFAALDVLEAMLHGRRYLLGDTLTEADVRLFPTLFRFDAVYHTRFHLGECMVRDKPALARWLAHLESIPAIAAASNLEHCRKGYFGRTGNNLVPLGPAPALGDG